MSKTITFNELRRLKDSLPDGSTHRIADELNVTVQTVRNYFGGAATISLAKTPECISNRVPTVASLFWMTPQSMIWLSRFLKNKTSNSKINGIISLP